GIDAFVFPGWFLGQIEQSYYANGKTYRTRPFRHWSALRVDKKFNDKKTEWVPVRFVQGCVNGHLSDINWRDFAHDDFKTSCQKQLWLDEAGSGNDFDEIFVRCECGKRRPLSQTKIPNSPVLGGCNGEMPWLKVKRGECKGLKRDGNGDLQETGRTEPNRLLVRSASNAYFSHTVSVISIPDKSHELYKAINEFYEGDLEEINDFDDLTSTIKRKRYAMLHPFNPEEIWEALQNRRENNTTEAPDRSIKSVELEALMQAPLEHSPEAQQNHSKDDLDFEAARRSHESIQPAWQPYLSQVVLIHRLREVIAQIGFTRFESSLPDVEAGDLDINPRRGSLATEMKWVPAIENKGEGIFLAFDRKAVETWVTKPEAKARNDELYQSYQKWLDSRGVPTDKDRYPGVAYILLHTLSHLLITEIALDCGYSASAIKERIYAIKNEGYGILLFTSTSGSEGSLGGLVNLGYNIENHLRRALQRG
ncbi:MAG: DrmB family protein, partial [Synechococcales cyanobacterium]